MNRSEMTCETCIFSAPWDSEGKELEIIEKQFRECRCSPNFKKVWCDDWCGDGSWKNPNHGPESREYPHYHWGEWEDE